MTHKPLNFEQVEALRKRMLLTTSDMAKLLGVSRQGYYDWRKNNKIRRKREDEVRAKIKLLLSVLVDHQWPTPEVIGMEPPQRLERLEALLEELG